jgi:hypothetical protein
MIPGGPGCVTWLPTPLDGDEKEAIMLAVEIFHDEADCPNDNYGWKLYSFSPRHASFKGLDSFSYRVQDKIDKGEAHWLSFYQHGDCWWGLAGGKAPAGVEFTWDGVRIAGVLVWEEDEAAPGPHSAEAFLNEYTNWVNGESYGFVILDEDGETVDSCGGLIGGEWTAQCVADNLPPGQAFQVTGNGSHLEGMIRYRVSNPSGRVGLA